MNAITIQDFNLRHTIESGQPLSFHAKYDWEKKKLSYNNGMQELKISFSQSEECKIKISAHYLAQAKNEFYSRFRLNDNMKKIYSNISTDNFMESAIREYSGMRVTLNDPWETTVCFILSQYNNMKRIRKITMSLKQKYGERAIDGSVKFPTILSLNKAKEEDLKECGMGFRAKYILAAAEFCKNNIDLYSLRGRGYDTIKANLMEIYGVGDKVADCIALMGYGELRAFPIDVWVKRTMEKVYFKGRDKKIPKLMDFAQEQWGEYRGYAQQYLFWHGLNVAKK